MERDKGIVWAPTPYVARAPRYAYGGVDPGFTGAIATIETIMDEVLIEVQDMPVHRTTRDRIDRRKVVGIFKGLLAQGVALVVAVEAVGAMGGKKNKDGSERKEGTASVSHFSQGQGEILGIVTALGATVFEVPPAVWKAKAGLIGASDREVCKRAVELGLAPKSMLFGPKGGPKHGRADALFLARHARQLVEGSK